MRYAGLISSAFLITAASQVVNADQVEGQRLPEKLTYRTPEKATWPWPKEKKEEKKEKQKEREEEEEKKEEEEEEEEEEDKEKSKKKKFLTKIMTATVPCMPTRTVTVTIPPTLVLTTMPCMPTKPLR
ncbi:hypothetical protein V1505DRAFT_358712 [Lipomyces doorenjongii]